MIWGVEVVQPPVVFSIQCDSAVPCCCGAADATDLDGLIAACSEDRGDGKYVGAHALCGPLALPACVTPTALLALRAFSALVD
jgi:hypothetical protein